MPWCTGCDRFLSPSTVTAAGECPRCGATVEAGRAHPPEAHADDVSPRRSPIGTEGRAPATEPASAAPDAAAADDDEAPIPLPWHFKLLVGAIALYLGWRAFQGIEWVVHRF